MAVNIDVGAHPHQFGNVHEAVFKNGFGNHWRAVGRQHQSEKLSLKVGRKTGIIVRHYVFALQPAVFGVNNDAVRLFYDSYGLSVYQLYSSAGDGGGNGVRAGFNAVGNYLVNGAVQLPDAFDCQNRRADTRNFCAHGIEHFRQIADFRFHGGIFNDRGSFG